MKMEIFFSVVWPTVHRPPSSENCQRKRIFLQMLSREWRFLTTPFSRTLNRELCQRRRRRQRKRHCLKDFMPSVGRDFSDWCKMSVECRWICLELNSWGPPPRLREGEREICSLVFTSSIKSHLREFHVAVVQWRQRNVQKSVLHMQSCCFANINLFFCRSRCHRHRRAKAPSWVDENGSFWEK